MMEPSEVARALHDRFNAQDYDGLYALSADDVTYEAPGLPPAHGKAARIALEQVWIDAFPGATNRTV